MLTVFPTFVFSPTRSNNPIRVAKAYCSQRGSDDATMPLSAYKRAAWCLPSCPCSPRVSASSNSGVTQGYPLSPTIFNVVVDAVVRHWFTLAVEEAETRGGGGGRAGTRRPSSTRTTTC